jgi:hypothetical protein
MTFRKFLEEMERKAPEDKGKQKPMDSLGGREEELNIEPDVLKKILQTEPQVAAHVDFRGLDWKLMPYKIKNLNTVGADIETMGDIPGTRAFRKGQRVKGDLGGFRGWMRRKKVVDALDQGWGPAVQAAQGGGAGAPPPGGAPAPGGL